MDTREITLVKEALPVPSIRVRLQGITTLMDAREVLVQRSAQRCIYLEA